MLAAQKLISQDKVFALLGVLGSGVVQATQGMTVERGLPYLFPLASSDITYLPHNPLKFAAYALSSEHMRAAVEFAYSKLGKRRFGILYQDDETGTASLRAVEAQLKTAHRATAPLRTASRPALAAMWPTAPTMPMSA